MEGTGRLKKGERKERERGGGERELDDHIMPICGLLPCPCPCPIVQLSNAHSTHIYPPTNTQWQEGGSLPAQKGRMPITCRRREPASASLASYTAATATILVFLLLQLQVGFGTTVATTATQIMLPIRRASFRQSAAFVSLQAWVPGPCLLRNTRYDRRRAPGMSPISSRSSSVAASAFAGRVERRGVVSMASFSSSLSSSAAAINSGMPSASANSYNKQKKNNNNNVEDTIFALSSGQGRAGVAVIRVSGPRAKESLEALTAGGKSNGPKSPQPRVAALRKLYDPITHELLDQALVLWFPAPRSFTGEDTVELHLHGSRAVIQGVTHALLNLDKHQNDDKKDPNRGDIRPADRGEFTERAFGNGRMDLTEVEGLADLIAADTAAQRKQALRQMGGALRQTYEGWREELKHCLAHTEAVIDFGDDEHDVDEAAYDAIRPRASKLREEMRRQLADGNRGEVIRSGIRVAIVGPPNAGKSTLLNLLARRPAAIVSPIAGTTRDVVEVQLELAGLPVLVSDTAGIRAAAADPVEQEGIRRARAAAEQAQLTLIVLDASKELAAEELRSLAGVGPFPAEEPPQALAEVVTAVNGDPGLLLLVNKRDAVVAGSDVEAELVGTAISAADGEVDAAVSMSSAFFISCATGEGVDGMLGGLQRKLEAVFDQGTIDGDQNEIPVITRARHRMHVERCVMALTAFLEDRSLGLDTAAEELRIASTELGRITGAVDVEEVLDVIFRDFCIGK